MKTVFLQYFVLLLLLPAALFSQTISKGFTVTKESQSPTSGKTYALIVGISKYQNPNITQLRFADRDAFAFREYLIAMGVDSSHIILLLNEHAKSGDIWASISYLTDSLKKGERAYFYFSCHGDVEAKTIVQDAFLLPYDAPSAVYSAGGTIAMYALKGWLATLSARGVEVIFIADACRSGNLAGGREGIQITSSILKENWKDETKILSCAAGEISIEGEQWGNGRGLFSYEFIRGITGLADKNDDGLVNLRELNLYLLDKVSEEAYPTPQNPVILGNMGSSLALVNKDYLLKIKSENFPHAFSSVDIRANEEHLLRELPDSIRLFYKWFTTNIDLEEEKGVYGNFRTLYFRLMGIPENDYSRLLLGIMKRNLAAAMINKVNAIVGFTVGNRSYTSGYATYSFGIEDSFLVNLIGETRLIQMGIRSKIYFNDYNRYNQIILTKAFQDYIGRISSDTVLRGSGTKASLEFENAMQIKEPNSSYYLEAFSSAAESRKDYTKAKQYALKAVHISPTFAYPTRRLADIYLILNQPDSAIYYSRKLMALNPKVANRNERVDSMIFVRDACERISLAYWLKNSFDSSLFYRKIYFDSVTQSRLVLEKEEIAFKRKVALLLYDQKRFDEAIPLFEAVARAYKQLPMIGDTVVKKPNSSSYQSRSMSRLSFCYRSIAACYALTFQSDSANYYLSKMLEIDKLNWEQLIQQPGYSFDPEELPSNGSFLEFTGVDAEEFESLRSTPEFQSFMKKYFPDQ